MSTRGDELLRAAAAALEEMIDPFSDSWLRDNEVTSQECFDLSDQMAQAIRAWVAIKDNVPLLGAVIAQMTVGTELANAMFTSALMSDATKQLKEMRT